MFTRRRRARVAYSATSASIADGQAAVAAQTVVRRAWAEASPRRSDHAQFAVDGALEGCDAARWYLEAARCDVDPRKVSCAHPVLERAAQAGHASMLARDQVRRTLRPELEALTVTTQQRMVAALVRQLARGGPVINAARLETPGLPFGQIASDVAAAQRELRAQRWLGRPTCRAAGLEQP